MEPAAPSVERATVLEDTVKRGSIIRQVRGVGTLVPEDTRWLPATTEGRVERILLRPGATVAADSVILVLSNPQVEQEALNARLALQSARAGLDNLRAQLQNDLLTQQSQAAAIQSDFEQARIGGRGQRSARQGTAGLGADSQAVAPQGRHAEEPRGHRDPPPHRRARLDRGAAARAAGHGRSGAGDDRPLRQPAAGAAGDARLRRGAAAGAGRRRPAGGAGPEPRACRRSGTPQGGIAGRGDRSARHRGGPAGRDRHPHRQDRRPREPQGSGRRERNRHHRRLTDGRTAARRRARSQRRRHRAARTARERALRRPPVARPGQQHRRAVQGDASRRATRRACRSSSAPARSTRSSWSRASRKATGWCSRTCRRGTPTTACGFADTRLVCSRRRSPESPEP